MKEKRKTRLNKTRGTKAEFLGFGAFATAADDDNQQSTAKSAAASLRWSPIYTGKDDHLASRVFPRLVKRDATTKAKALQDLQAFFRDDSLPRKQQVDALAHYLFLYHTKLSYESSSSVRADALLVLTLAASRVPKAFQTLIQQNNKQVLGMMYCCHGDAAAEVRAVASKCLPKENIIISRSSDDDQAFTRRDLQAGVWDYVEQILSYGRASKMHEGLFASSMKNNSSGGTANKNNNKGTDDANNNNNNNYNNSNNMNESQKDQMEERFERIVGSALSGMQVWIQHHGILPEGANKDSSDAEIVASSMFLWKTLSSPKASLRNRTYALLGTCCQKAPQILYQSKYPFHQTIPQALATEKEAGNISSLLEALLTYLAAYSKFNGAESSPWDSMDAGVVTKHLVKLFKKSCHGASATQWAPLLLPLLTMLPSTADQVAVLSAVWKGREHTIRMGDHMVVMSTVSEAASFFLLRKESPDTKAAVNEDGEPLSKVLSRLWNDCFKSFLEKYSSGKSNKSSSRSADKNNNMNPTQQAQQALIKGLGSELQRFDDACSNRPTCALYAIRDWFWAEEASPCILETEGNVALAMIVQELCSHSKDNGGGSARLPPILNQKFLKVLEGFQQTSGAVPTDDAYQLMLAVLKYCGVGVLTQADGEDSLAMDKFLMNDVLRWIVIHTSSLSSQKQSKSLVQNDFALFAICASYITEEQRRQLWDSLLKEVIAAKCRLNLFIAGLVALLKHEKTTIEQVQCDILDSFVMQIVDDAFSSDLKTAYTDDTSQHEEGNYDSLTEFLQTCAGISKAGVPALVRRHVITSWIDRSCPELGKDDIGNDNIVPVPILETLLLLIPSTLMQEEAHRVILQTWKQGGHVWSNIGVDLLLKESSYLLPLFDQGPSLLCETLRTWSVKPGDAKANEAAHEWSERAWRLLELSKLANRQGIQAPVASLSLVKLGDSSLWEASTDYDFHFSCLMHLLRNEESARGRLALFQTSGGGDETDSIIAILTALSEASGDIMSATRASKRMDHSAQLFATVGGKDLGRTVLKKWLKACVASLKHHAEKQDIARIGQCVALISQLCDAMVVRVKPRDIFSTEEDDDLGDEFERENIAKLFVPLLCEENFTSLPWHSSFAELVNVVVSQCGLGSERGIGSIHHDVFQLLRDTESRLQNLLVVTDGVNNKEAICQDLWTLSFSCGFGLNTPPAVWDSQLLMFDPEKVTLALLDFIENNPEGETTDLGRAILSWFMTASVVLKDRETRTKVVTYIYQRSTSLLSSTSQGAFDGTALLGLRGISMAQVASKTNMEDVANLNSQAIMQVFHGFCQWENEALKRGVIRQDFSPSCNPIEVVQPTWRSFSQFPEIFASALKVDSNLMIAAEFSEFLVDALSSESKRWYAMKMLDAMAKSTRILGDPTPEAETARRLTEWTRGLDEEEKGELEEDVEIVSELLPHKLMTEMESWAEEAYADTLEDSEIIGKMLTWLCCLQYVDSFVQKDVANRPSLCSYIGKSGVVHSILNLTILHSNVISETDPNFDLDQLLRTEEFVDESNLAALVLLRSVEILPSITRRWWEDECPKVYTGPIRDYIATHIAPLILTRELERLKIAIIKNKFGDMAVSGSVSTREVVAMYAQDEIRLKVMIQLPDVFPLRNAEVDCSKTLGVKANRWKLWSLQITMMLNNQGGTLQEALMLWKENVDQEFEGVEPCPVCYSVLHVKTHKLPELECTTCSNRFHSQCLTQWFRSSGKQQCVICQQPWVGTRVKK